MGQHRERGRILVSVIYPTLTGCAPQFEVVTERDTSDERKECIAIIRRREDHQRTDDERTNGIGFIERRCDEPEHDDIERREDHPVKWTN